MARHVLSFAIVAGDVIIASGTLSYLGPFTSEYRTRIADSWVEVRLCQNIRTKGWVVLGWGYGNGTNQEHKVRKNNPDAARYSRFSIDWFLLFVFTTRIGVS